MTNDANIESDAIERNSIASDPWTQLRAINDPGAFARIWLAQQINRIGEGVLQGVVVLSASHNAPITPVAIWPDGAMGSPGLVAAIEASIKSSGKVIRSGGRSSTAGAKQNVNVMAIPLIVGDTICGAAGIEIEECTPQRLEEIANQMAWGSAWLDTLVLRNTHKLSERLVGAFELMATALHHERFQAAATAVATELAGMLACERVSISFISGKHAKLSVLSHSAGFGKKANVIRAIEAAMDEAIDQQATIVYPNQSKDNFQVVRAHEQLVSEHHTGTICTVPLAQGERMLGAITLERPRDVPFDRSSVELSEHLAALLGPLLDIKRKDDRWLIRKAADSGKDTVVKLIGPRHVTLKLVSSCLLLLVLFFSFAKGDYRVSVDSRIEGAVQRAVTTPIAGYIATANFRAGDIVKKGDQMFSLDDRELILERVKWTSQRSQYRREHSAAVATHERARANVLAAQMEQADAQIALVEEQLTRIKGIAPFDSIVVSGDLSQSLGAPVERGDVLFEIAPLDSYRVILKVEERDVANVAIGQTGSLVLTGIPDKKIPIVIEKITPVAIAEEGVNYFRIEAGIVGELPTVLRPGMEGVAKVNIDQRKLIWIWTYKVTHWLRMFFWSWLP